MSSEQKQDKPLTKTNFESVLKGVTRPARREAVRVG